MQVSERGRGHSARRGINQGDRLREPGAVNRQSPTHSTHAQLHESSINSVGRNRCSKWVKKLVYEEAQEKIMARKGD